MIDTVAIHFSIRTPSSSYEAVVDSHQARIGSGGHCEIRLTEDGVAFEHVLLEERTSNLYAEVRCTELPVLLNGAPFLQGRLLPGSVLRFGEVEVEAQLVDRSGLALDAPRKRKRGRAMRVAVGLLGVITIAGAMLGTADEEASVTLAQAPKLWPETEPQLCGNSGPQLAAGLAEEHWLRAVTARERAPFSAEDGVRAVQDFEQAQVCFLTAGNSEAAIDARNAADHLKRELERDFHVHQVRLERALITRHYLHARVESQMLLSFAGQRSDPYFTWLANLDRQMAMQFSNTKE